MDILLGLILIEINDNYESYRKNYYDIEENEKRNNNDYINNNENKNEENKENKKRIK